MKIWVVIVWINNFIFIHILSVYTAEKKIWNVGQKKSLNKMKIIFVSDLNRKADVYFQSKLQ